VNFTSAPPPPDEYAIMVNRNLKLLCTMYAIAILVIDAISK